MRKMGKLYAWFATETEIKIITTTYETNRVVPVLTVSQNDAIIMQQNYCICITSRYGSIVCD